MSKTNETCVIAEGCSEYTAPKLEYIQVMRNDMSPWEVGAVYPILERTSDSSGHYFLYQGEGAKARIYQASACRLISKTLHDLLASRVPLPIFHDTPPEDESNEGCVKLHKEARDMYETEWVTYVTEKCNFKRLKFTITIERETFKEHAPIEVEALIALNVDELEPYYGYHMGNYVAAYGAYQDELGKCTAQITKSTASHYMSLEVAMQETKDQILAYWFDINPTRKVIN
jgi:hypothetical protein